MYNIIGSNSNSDNIATPHSMHSYNINSQHNCIHNIYILCFVEAVAITFVWNCLGGLYLTQILIILFK